MRLGEALARCPELVLVTPDPDRTESAWDEALSALEGIGAAVESERPGEAFFAEKGLRGLWGGRVEDVIARARRAIDVPARLAAGPTRFCAYAAATRVRPRGRRRSRSGKRPRAGQRTHETAIVKPRAMRPFLAPLPVELLRGRLEEGSKLPATLERLGIRTLGRARRAAPRRGRRPLRPRGPGGVGPRARRGRRGCARAPSANGSRRASTCRRRSPAPSSSARWRCWSTGCWPIAGGAGGRCAGCGSPRGSPPAGAGASRCRCARRARRASGCCWRSPPSSSSSPAPPGGSSSRRWSWARSAHAQGSLARDARERRRALLAEAVRQARAAAGRDAVLRVLEVDPGSRVPERRAILAPFPEPQAEPVPGPRGLE